MVAAIDYTLSNGYVSDRNSLHYMREGQYNQYQEALYNVGKILEPYDYDRNFPVFGFGGQARHLNFATSHCFAINGQANPEINGIENILQVYQQTLAEGSIKLSAPTYFYPLLSEFRKFVLSSMERQVYPVLMILTDGCILDMDATLTEVVELSALPCSIIIIGVGNANFDAMESLDCDKGTLRDSRGRTATRDIV